MITNSGIAVVSLPLTLDESVDCPNLLSSRHLKRLRRVVAATVVKVATAEAGRTVGAGAGRPARPTSREQALGVTVRLYYRTAPVGSPLHRWLPAPTPIPTGHLSRNAA